jgi:hypothetical protein
MTYPPFKKYQAEGRPSSLQRHFVMRVAFPQVAPPLLDDRVV